MPQTVFLLSRLAVCGFVFTLLGYAQMNTKPKMQRYVASLRLYQSSDELYACFGNDPKPLVAYAKNLEVQAAAWEKLLRPPAQGLLIVVGLKPGKRSRIWCESALSGNIDPEAIKTLERELAILPAPEVRGPVAFAVQMRLLGREVEVQRSSADDAKGFPEFPKRWAELAARRGQPLKIPEDVFRALWPD